MRPPPLACDNGQWKVCTRFVLRSQYGLVRGSAPFDKMPNMPLRNDPLSRPPTPLAIFSHEAAERDRLRIRSEQMEAKARALATLAESYELLRQVEEGLARR